MVSGDNFSDGALKARPALSDLTNRPTKRPFSSISTDSPHKSSDDGDSRFAKQLCEGVEHFVKHKCHLQFATNADSDAKGKVKGKHPSPQELPPRGAVVDASLRNLSPQEPNSPATVAEERHLLCDGVVSNLPESSLGFGEGAQGRNACHEVDDREDCVLDNVASAKSVTVETPTISASRESRFPGLERCTAFKGFDGATSAASSGDLLKNCSCSFCSKAAYIWSDLHYQDVKGRLSALRKSQKDASTTLQKFSSIKDKVVYDQHSDETTKLEFSLMEQWKSLFVHMQNTFAQESKQLESSFGALKDLRENCKNDLDLTDNSHSDNH